MTKVSFQAISFVITFKGEWVVYDDRIISLLESTLKNGDKAQKGQIQVDEERYIDMNRMVQARFDAANKQRPVMRKEEKVPLEKGNVGYFWT
jgi:hypothetical protein